MKRSILSLLYLIQGMRKAGINVDQKLERIGLNEKALDPSSIIHPSLEQSVLAALGEGIAPEQGLIIGQQYSLAGHGPLLMLLVASDNIEKVLEKGVEYSRLTHLNGHLDVQYFENKIALRLKPLNLDTQLGCFLAHCEVSGTYRFILDLFNIMDVELPSIQVSLPFNFPENPELKQMYTDVFGDEIAFNSEQAMFYFDREILHKKIMSADPISFKAYEQKCENELMRLREVDNNPSLIQRVKDYLELQQGTIPSMAETSKALKIPERTLRHQLCQMQTSYKQIREDVIKQKALKLIEYQEYSIETIAHLLGYSEPAAFNHAFKRWFGYSPRQYK